MADLPEDEQQQLAAQAERVRQMLRDAFPSASCKSLWGKTFTHADFVEMRLDLPLFWPESLQLILPHILEDLIDTHSDDEGDENAEYLLMELNMKL